MQPTRINRVFWVFFAGIIAFERLVSFLFILSLLQRSKAYSRLAGEIIQHSSPSIFRKGSAAGPEGARYQVVQQ